MHNNIFSSEPLIANNVHIQNSALLARFEAARKAKAYDSSLAVWKNNTVYAIEGEELDALIALLRAEIKQKGLIP